MYIADDFVPKIDQSFHPSKHTQPKGLQCDSKKKVKIVHFSNPLHIKVSVLDFKFRQKFKFPRNPETHIGLSKIWWRQSCT